MQIVGFLPTKECRLNYEFPSFLIEKILLYITSTVAILYTITATIVSFWTFGSINYKSFIEQPLELRQLRPKTVLNGAVIL